MVPIQIGEADTMFVIGLVLFGVVVVLIAYGLRRSTRISDELSAEWEKKPKEIRPTATIQREQVKGQLSPPRDEKVRDLTIYSTLQAELRDNKTQLQHSLQEIVAFQENETTMRKEIEGLRTEIGTLQERLLASRDLIQELRASTNQSVKPQIVSQPPEIRTRDTLVAKTAVQSQHGVWTRRIFGNNPSPRECPTCRRRLGSKDRYCDSCGRAVPVTI